MSNPCDKCPNRKELPDCGWDCRDLAKYNPIGLVARWRLFRENCKDCSDKMSYCNDRVFVGCTQDHLRSEESRLQRERAAAIVKVLDELRERKYDSWYALDCISWSDVKEIRAKYAAQARKE